MQARGLAKAKLFRQKHARHVWEVARQPGWRGLRERKSRRKWPGTRPRRALRNLEGHNKVKARKDESFTY